MVLNLSLEPAAEPPRGGSALDDDLLGGHDGIVAVAGGAGSQEARVGLGPAAERFVEGEQFDGGEGGRVFMDRTEGRDAPGSVRGWAWGGDAAGYCGQIVRC